LTPAGALHAFQEPHWRKNQADQLRPVGRQAKVEKYGTKRRFVTQEVKENNRS